MPIVTKIKKDKSLEKYHSKNSPCFNLSKMHIVNACHLYVIPINWQ